MLLRNKVLIAFLRPKMTILDLDFVSGPIVTEFTPYNRDAWEYGLHRNKTSERLK